jgi:hypothetical protein
MAVTAKVYFSRALDFGPWRFDIGPLGAFKVGNVVDVPERRDDWLGRPDRPATRAEVILVAEDGMATAKELRNVWCP